MIKVFNNATSGQIFQTIANCFLDYMPTDTFQETGDIQDADIIFGTGTIRGNQVDVNISHHQKVNLSNLQTLSNLYGAMAEKRWVIWFDTVGPNVNKSRGLFDHKTTGLRDTDIFISSVSVSKKPNAFTHLYPVEKNLFKSTGRYERKPKSVVISHDNILNSSDPSEDTISIVKGILDEVSHLYVTNRAELDETVKLAFRDNLDKVSCQQLSYPKDVAYQLAQAEFVLSTPTKLGAEFMGIEGGMTGCQPIYPDTPFYRDIYEDTGVVFFDTNDPIESLKSIIQIGSNFDKETTDNFRTKFSAEDNLPDFWEKVHQLLSNESKST